MAKTLLSIAAISAVTGAAFTSAYGIYREVEDSSKKSVDGNLITSPSSSSSSSAATSSFSEELAVPPVVTMRIEELRKNLVNAKNAAAKKEVLYEMSVRMDYARAPDPEMYGSPRIWRREVYKACLVNILNEVHNKEHDAVLSVLASEVLFFISQEDSVRKRFGKYALNYFLNTLKNYKENDVYLLRHMCDIVSFLITDCAENLAITLDSCVLPYLCTMVDTAKGTTSEVYIDLSKAALATIEKIATSITPEELVSTIVNSSVTRATDEEKMRVEKRKEEEEARAEAERSKSEGDGEKTIDGMSDEQGVSEAVVQEELEKTISESSNAEEFEYSDEVKKRAKDLALIARSVVIVALAELGLAHLGAREIFLSSSTRMSTTKEQLKATATARRYVELAQRNLNYCLHLDPTRGDIAFAFGTRMKRADTAEEAAECFQRAIEIDPTNTPARAQLGLLLIRQARHETKEAGVRELETVLAEMNGTYGNENRLRISECGGVIREQQLGREEQDGDDDDEDDEKEEDLFAQRVGNKESDQEEQEYIDLSRLYSELSTACGSMKQYDTAIQHGEKAVHLDSSRARYHYALARALKDYSTPSSSGSASKKIYPRLVEAIEQFQQAADCDDVSSTLLPSIFYNIGICRRRLGQHGEAVDSFRRAAKLSEWDVNPRFALGATLMDLEQYEEAIQCYREINLLHPDHPEVYFGLALAYRQLQRREEEVKAKRRIVGILKKNVELEADYFATKGRSYIKDLHRMIQEEKDHLRALMGDRRNALEGQADRESEEDEEEEQRRKQGKTASAAESLLADLEKLSIIGTREY